MGKGSTFLIPYSYSEDLSFQSTYFLVLAPTLDFYRWTNLNYTKQKDEVYFNLRRLKCFPNLEEILQEKKNQVIERLKIVRKKRESESFE